MEYFELLNADGTGTGVFKERALVHRDGDLHGGSHIWVIRRAAHAPYGYPVLLQKRRDDKESFPGCLDVSCAGHVKAGESFLDAALRELSEELGLSCRAEDLYYLHDQRVDGDYVFLGQPFRNHEINKVYLLRPDFPLEGLRFQEEEIAALVWMDTEEALAACREKAYDPSEPAENSGERFCIWPSEMENLCRSLKKGRIGA